jgi:hypothetical protein
MTNFYFKLLNKDNKHSENNAIKYETIGCQSIITKDYDTTKIIKLEDIIKENSDLKIFEGLFLKINVVIKISNSETILREYDISQLLNNKNTTFNIDDKYKYLTINSYFIKYLCYFNCKNNIKNIINNSSICSNDGELLNILIMKKYNLGSIKKYNWNFDNFNILITLIKQIIYALYSAFINYGFIHNDVHFGNFLIRNNNSQYNVIIIDFENSLFDFSKINNIIVLYQNYKQILNNILLELNIITFNIDLVLNYIDININNNTIFDINYLLELTDNIKMKNKLDLSNLTYTYNPNIF